MKTIPQLILLAGAVSIQTSSLLAIEAPEDDAPPPPVLEEKEAPAPAEAAQAAFIGLVCAEVPEMLATHLGLEPAQGIVVSALQPDGPADKSGIKTHDVILRIAEQEVRNQEDVARIVTGHKPGDVVQVDLFQKGKKQQLKVTLAERPKELMAADGPRIMALEGLPADQEKKIRDLIEKNLLQMELPLQPDALGAEDVLRQMREQMGRALDENRPNAAPGGIKIQGGATIRMMDENGSVEIKTIDGGKEVTVRDKQNEIVWTGPWDTEQDKAAAPLEARQRVERLNIDEKFMGGGLRLNFRGPALENE